MEIHMSEKVFNETLKKVQNLAHQIDEEMNKLLTVVENDQRFILEKPMFEHEDQGPIPKWEKRSVMCLYADSCNLRDAIDRHVKNLD